MNIEYVKKLIDELGFAPQDGTSGVFVKHYAAYNNYPIFVDFNEQKIEYAHQSIQQDKRIRLGDLTTSSFKAEKSERLENFVVLECIDRLLTNGYHPERLELEKKYPLGRNLKGKLDILVYSENDDSPFLMIECKTWGSEFEKESAKTLKDGGQIFSYYQQDRAAKILCLYASRLDREKIEYRNNIVLVEKSWRDLSSAKDIHDYWNKNFKDNGIFEVYATPYDIKPKALTYGMLKNLKEEDSGKIYNQIMEILRHNAISDKPNAFNKLLNLFVCKIIDENQNPTDELGFQWLDTDTDESLQMRLNDLYKEGMWRFLEIKIIDHSEEDVTKALEGIDNPTQKLQLMDMFRDARLKKSPNFAFVEVLDEKTFRLNAKIVREIVELLQVYKFRYEQKHEFLGNFFELLLNTSMKQEAGQFFTPVPITRFIISSLPLKEFVQSKIDSRERNVLPVVMDYACGSGHFLTEYMDQLQNVIESKIDVSAALPNIKNMIQSWQGLTKFLWAKDSVYGIDLDNRLVKTTKVSAFFNGDGDANIIWANGLDNFEKTEEYRGLLRQTQPYDRKNNGQFDILISNPPYSVEAFKSTLKYGEETFELYNNITDNSSEIECLFIERMKQLLKIGGWAGVILPSSILSNGGIHSKAREILFKYFKVKSIVELGSGTFMKTGTNTVVLFLERRSESDFVTIEKAVNVFVSNLKDVTVLGIENAFSKYVANVYDDLAFDDYISFISGNASVALQEHEMYSDYKNSFDDDVYAKAIALEKEKMLYFLLTYEQNIVLIKTGQKLDEKKFLGYEFSERRGHEGIKHLPNGTKLFDESGDLMNPQRANSYIYNAFLGKVVSVDESLARNVSYGRMSGFINYGTNKFDKAVNLSKKQKVILNAHNTPLVSLGEVAKIEKGQTLTSSQAESGNVPVVAGGISPSITHNQANRQAGVITVSASGANAGYVNYWDVPIFATDCNTIFSIDENVILTRYLFVCLKSLQQQIFSLQAGQAQPHVYERDLRTIKVPLPPLKVQQKIVTEIDSLEREEGDIKQKIIVSTDMAKAIYNQEKAGYPTKQLSGLIEIVSGGTPKTTVSSYWNGGIPWLSIADFNNGERFVENSEKTISEQGLSNSNAEYIYPSEIIISARGTVGSIAQVKIPMTFNQSCYGIRGLKDIDNNYLYFALKYEVEQIKSNAYGMVFDTITIKTFDSIFIPLPPLVKQQEIAAEIEKTESEVAAQKVRLEELKTQKGEVLSNYL